VSSGDDLSLFGDLHSRAAERRVRETGGFFGESPTVVQRLIDSGTEVRHLVVSSRRRQFLDSVPAGIASTVLDEPDLYDLVGFEMHRGVIGLFERPSDVDIDDQASKQCVAIVEGVNDADNLGSLVRTAVALGVTGIVCDPTTVDLFTRRCVRVSMGTVGAMTVSRPANWPPDFGNRTIVAMSPGGIHRLTEIEFVGALGVAFGAEGGGLSQSMLDAADVVVSIPMSSGVDSLNVSHAAAIALHHFSSNGSPRP
jgi:tRNA G18 (ribose-2'-O)-methylase SpoU